MSEPFFGEINLFAGNFAPRGWALCQGQLLSISQNTALFALLGTTYGGNGTTTFGLPDLRGRAIVGAGQGSGLSNYTLGELAGSETVSLALNQTPVHSHAISATATLGAQSGNANQQQPAANRVPAIPTIGTTVGLKLYSTQPPDTDIEGAQIGGNLDLGGAGGSQPHNNVQPFLALNYIIALQGIFPSRN
jgi:microcystin-dependent protein